MTNEQIKGFRLGLKTLSLEELNELRDQVNAEIADQYWCDENFFRREEMDSYIYVIVYDDLHCYYDFLGKRAYEKYLSEENAIRLECKTKRLFPEWKLLMRKGDILYEQERIRPTVC